MAHLRTTRDYFAILKVDFTAPEEDIKKSYRTLAFQWHPDKNPNNEQATAKFQEIQEAYETLSDPKNRKLYTSRWPGRWSKPYGSRQTQNTSKNNQNYPTKPETEAQFHRQTSNKNSYVQAESFPGSQGGAKQKQKEPVMPQVPVQPEELLQDQKREMSFRAGHFTEKIAELLSQVKNTQPWTYGGPAHWKYKTTVGLTVLKKHLTSILENFYSAQQTIIFERSAVGNGLTPNEMKDHHEEMSKYHDMVREALHSEVQLWQCFEQAVESTFYSANRGYTTISREKVPGMPSSSSSSGKNPQYAKPAGLHTNFCDYCSTPHSVCPKVVGIVCTTCLQEHATVIIATPVEIKQSYRALALKHHPDKNRNISDATSKFQIIQEAYECLSDPTKRVTYDELRQNGTEKKSDQEQPKQPKQKIYRYQPYYQNSRPCDGKSYKSERERLDLTEIYDEIYGLETRIHDLISKYRIEVRKHKDFVPELLKVSEREQIQWRNLITLQLKSKKAHIQSYSEQLRKCYDIVLKWKGFQGDDVENEKMEMSREEENFRISILRVSKFDDQLWRKYARTLS